MKSGITLSCGCASREAVARACTKHGLYKSREYSIWASMIQRCHNPKSPSFEHYGAKGLIVDPRWRQFVNFYADMGPSPDGYSLDRLDNAKGYAPNNCRWANTFEQNRNRSLSHWITWNGERLTVSEWARQLRVGRNTIKHRWTTHQSLAPLKPCYSPRRHAT